MHYIDLTHVITDNMPVFPGDIPVQLKPTVTFEQDGVANHSLCGSLHMGTHIDAPGHFTARHKKITDFPISTFIGNGVCINAQGLQETDVALVHNKIQQNDIVLFCTGFDKYFYQPNYFYDYPIITQDCAEYLIEAKPKMVGVDFPSVDKAPHEVHKLLLNHDILIIENLTNLHLLLEHNNIEIIALPLKVDGHGAPARVIAAVK